jgi:hypothetical protein
MHGRSVFFLNRDIRTTQRGRARFFTILGVEKTALAISKTRFFKGTPGMVYNLTNGATFRGRNGEAGTKEN